MNIKHALEFAIKKINILDAEVLLSRAIKKNKTFLYTHPECKLNNNQINKFKKNIIRRSGGEPVAYIVKNKKFYNLDFFVNKNVLIPRPETELLVEECLKICRDAKSCVSTIIDIGAGSGCIIISLAKNVKNKNINFYATDISKKTLNIAQKNAKNNGINLVKSLRSHGVCFIKSNLLKNMNINLKNYILIANLPYLPSNFKNKYNLKFEPKKALYSGKDGLDLYNKLFLEIENLKYKPNYILLEFRDQQTKKIKKIIKNILPEYKIKIKKDLAGLNRILIAEKITNKN